jgi:AcrR family transcriptional regulator
MPKTKADSRTQLLRAAEKTTYLYGFGSASIADIAKEARVPLGNVYYYFKTKDEIGGAIVELRISRFKNLLQDLSKASSPRERLCGFVDIKIKNREALARGGCPVGTLCSECRNTAVQQQRNLDSCSQKPWPGWRSNSKRLAKEPIPEAWPYTFYPQPKAYQCSLTPSKIQP